MEAAAAGLADAVDIAATNGGWDGSILTDLLGDDPAVSVDGVMKAFPRRRFARRRGAGVGVRVDNPHRPISD